MAARSTFDFAESFKRIDRLHHTEDGRYLSDEEDAVLTSLVDSANTIRFGRIRRSGLPSLIDGPSVTSIFVPATGGIFECSQVVYFPPSIVGADFNFYAPRLSRLGRYVRAKARFARNLEFLPIYRADALAQLRRYETIKRATIKVATGALPALRRNAGTIASISEVAREQGAEFIELVLSSERGRNSGGLAKRILREIERLVTRGDTRQDLEKLRVSGYRTNETKLEALDLLADDLVATKTFILESVQDRTLNRNDAYAKITEAFRELRPDLQIE